MLPPDPAAAGIAAQLGARAPSSPPSAPSDVAFLQDGEMVYFSRGYQPVIRLIQGIYDFKPEQARRILRARIYSSLPVSEAERAMVKVAAKRLMASSPAQPDPRLRFIKAVEIVPKPPPPLLNPAELPREIHALLENREFMRATLAISERIPKKTRLYESDRRVAALLVSREQRFLAAAVNSNASNRTRHAEVNLVQAFLAPGASGGPVAIPRGSRIYVTLKCCKMCAAMIWCAAEDVSDLHVRYAQNDPGPNARSTVFTPFSFERRRASRNDHELSLEIERQEPSARRES